MKLFNEIKNNRINVTSEIKKFQVVVGKYFYPAKGKEYCELGVKNLETGEIGVMVFIHHEDFEQFRFAADEANWVVSCYLPSSYKSKSPFGEDACGKINFAKAEGKNICVYLGGEHAERVEMRSCSQAYIDPKLLRANELNILLWAYSFI
jgi:hypothetical protein